MTQETISRFWSILDRVFPATHQPTIALDGPSGVFEDEPTEQDEDRVYRDESYYWGWCMYGHW